MISSGHGKTMRSALFLFFALLLDACASLRVGGVVGRPSMAQISARRVVRDFTMKSQEDKEFEEWARKKKIASGVDPDEDFGAGRRSEGIIYVVGGALPALVPCRCTIASVSELLGRTVGRCDHRPGPYHRRHVGVPERVPHAAVSWDAIIGLLDPGALCCPSMRARVASRAIYRARLPCPAHLRHRVIPAPGA